MKTYRTSRKRTETPNQMSRHELEKNGARENAHEKAAPTPPSRALALERRKEQGRKKYESQHRLLTERLEKVGGSGRGRIERRGERRGRAGRLGECVEGDGGLCVFASRRRPFFVDLMIFCSSFSALKSWRRTARGKTRRRRGGLLSAQELPLVCNLRILSIVRADFRGCSTFRSPLRTGFSWRAGGWVDRQEGRAEGEGKGGVRELEGRGFGGFGRRARRSS